jgi:hypothetical protein
MGTSQTASGETPKHKLILSLDFDGVVHSYENGWQGGKLYGTFLPGFLTWAMKASQHFRLVIYSSRSWSEDEIEGMRAWMRRQLAERMMPNEAEHFISLFEFADKKPPAFVTIDDRAIQFMGRWDDFAIDPENLLTFKPWMQPEG